MGQAVNSPVGEDEVLLWRFFAHALPPQLSTWTSFGWKLYFILYRYAFNLGPARQYVLQFQIFDSNVIICFALSNLWFQCDNCGCEVNFQVTSTSAPLQSWSSCHCSSYGSGPTLTLRCSSFGWSSWTWVCLLTRYWDWPFPLHFRSWRAWMNRLSKNYTGFSFFFGEQKLS